MTKIDDSLKALQWQILVLQKQATLIQTISQVGIDSNIQPRTDLILLLDILTQNQYLLAKELILLPM